MADNSLKRNLRAIFCTDFKNYRFFLGERKVGTLPARLSGLEILIDPKPKGEFDTIGSINGVQIGR
jgi:hypothetical protein